MWIQMIWSPMLFLKENFGTKPNKGVFPRTNKQVHHCEVLPMATLQLNTLGQ